MKFKKILFSLLFFMGGALPLSVQAHSDVWSVLRQQFQLNHEITRPEVQEQLRWLIAHPSYLYKVSRQCEPYIYHILQQIKKRNLPGELALLPMIESAYDPFAYSGAGAAGLWQLMPRTGTDLGLKQDWWFDGRRSIGPSTNAALNYLIYLNKFFNSNWVFAIAAYDSGEGTIDRALKSSHQKGTTNFWTLSVPQETRIYVPRLLALSEIINNPERYKINLPTIPYAPYFSEVNIGSPIDLNHAAKLAGISYKELIKLNPGFNRWTTTPYKPYKLLIPTDKVMQFNVNLAHLPEEKRVSWQKHLVKNGDNLANIANRYHTTVNIIKELNQLSSNNLKSNQSLLIPSLALSGAHKESSKEAVSSRLAVQVAHNTTRRMVHIVQAKDSYQTLARKYQVTVQDIHKWNDLSDKEPLHAGKQLILWKKTSEPINYKVKPGDSLSVIAAAHHTTVHHLLDLNPRIGRNKALKIGQALLVG